MNLRRYLPAVLAAVVLAAVGAGSLVRAQPSSSQPAASQPAAEKPLLAKPLTATVFVTGDLHERGGNLVRIAGYVRQARAKDASVIFVDAGDFLDDSPGGPYPPAAIRNTGGKAMVEIMAAAGYDVVNMGNHDYKYGKDKLLELAAANPKFPLMAANMNWPVGQPRPNVPTHKVFTFGAFRVAVVPLASKYTNHLHGPGFPISEEGGVTYRQMLPDLRRASDAVVLMSHLFPYHDKRLFDANSDDAPAVMIGAHDHAALVRRTGRTLQLRAGCWAGQIGQITLTFDGRSVTAQGRLLKVDSSWPEDPAVKAVLEKYQAAPAAPAK